jgi:hypothetical protein
LGGSGAGTASPLVLPDGGEAGLVGVTGVTDGTEGFTPAGSVGEDGGSPGSPSTNRLGGAEGSPELLGAWLGAFDEGLGSVGVSKHGSGLGSSLLDVTGVGWWSPWLVWKWWDSWGFWWAEGGSESVHLGVLGEDSNVSIPGGFGCVVATLLSVVLGQEGVTGGPDGLCNLSWHVSDDS